MGNERMTIALGAELKELKAALDAKIISQAEFDRARRDCLDRVVASIKRAQENDSLAHAVRSTLLLNEEVGDLLLTDKDKDGLKRAYLQIFQVVADPARDLQPPARERGEERREPRPSSKAVAGGPGSPPPPPPPQQGAGQRRKEHVMRNTKVGPIRLDENGWRLCEQCGDYKVPWRDLPPKERNKESGKLSHHRNHHCKNRATPSQPLARESSKGDRGPQS